MQENPNNSYSAKCDVMIEQLDNYVSSIKKLKCEIEKLQNERSLALIHLSQYRQDYELLSNSFKNIYDYMVRNGYISPQQFQQISQNGDQHVQEHSYKSDGIVLYPTKVDQSQSTSLKYEINYSTPRRKNLSCNLKLAFFTDKTLTAIAMTKDNRYIACSDGTAIDIISTTDSTYHKVLSFPTEDVIESNVTRTLAFSPDDTLLAASYQGRHIAIYRLPDFQFICSFKNHTNDVSKIYFTKKGDMMISSGHDGNINIWSYPSLKFIRKINCLNEPLPISGFCETMNGDSFILAYVNGLVIQLDATTFNPISKFKIDSNLVLSVSSSALEPSIATCSNNDISIWTTVHNHIETIKHLTGHKDTVLKIAFSSQNRIAVSGSKDETIIMWDYSQQQPQLLQIFLKRNTIFDICHSTFDNHFASCSADGVICYWEYTI